MKITERIRAYFGRPRLSPAPGYPRVVARVGRDAEYIQGGILPPDSAYSFIQPNFPFLLYDVIDTVSVLDPYISEFIWKTCSLGNPGHKLYIQASSEKRADQAIKACNELAARCFPYAGGADGVINGLLNQLARAGAACIEWAPDKQFTQIARGFLLPPKTLRWRYVDEAGTLGLTQMQQGGLVPLNQVQTTYHALTLRDSNPYAIPPIVSALEASDLHRHIMKQIKEWSEKVSGLGLLTASVTAPPREPSETQVEYDGKAETYLTKIAESIGENMSNGFAVGYDNIAFQFNATAAGAQGAKDLLDLIVHGLFAALQRDPIFFGWESRATEGMASVVYQEMMQSLKIYQLGAKRCMEHGHRLNLALSGLGDIGVTLQFNQDLSVDRFKEAEAEQMLSLAVISQVEAGIITVEEARKILGHENKSVESGAFVASFSKGTNEYVKEPHTISAWQMQGDIAGVENEETDDGNTKPGGEGATDLHPGTFRERGAQIRAVT